MLTRSSSGRRYWSRLSARFALTLSLVLGVLLAIGLLLLHTLYQSTVIGEKRHHLQGFEKGMVSSLHSLLLTGNAELVREWLAETRTHPSLESIQVLRPGGKLAFRDRQTLRRVNAYLGGEAFTRPARPGKTPTDLPDALLQSALKGERVSRARWEEGRIDYLFPLVNEPACESCHGYSDRSVLGVVRVSTTLETAKTQLSETYWNAIGYALGMVLLAGLTVFLLVRWRILGRLHRLNGVAQEWGRGNLELRAEENGNDEIGDLADSLNRMAERLQGTFREIRELITQSQTGMMVVDDQNGGILFTNPAAQQLMNRSAEELEGTPLGIPVVSGRSTEIDIRRKDGSAGVAEISFQPTVWGGGSAFLVTFHDVTERQRAEQAARYQAYHDDLTGLPNRTSFRGALESALERAREGRSRLAVLFLDLDRFKEVNDTLGHAAGDQLLREVARRLRDGTRAMDTVARMSGDEFTIILEGVETREDALAVAEKLRDSLASPMDIEGNQITPAGTIGVSLYPDDGRDPETLLMRADTAMYEAKGSGRSQIQTFVPDQGKAASRRFRLEQGLRRAETQGEFRVFYQPQVSLADGGLKGLEALLRWEAPEHGMVSPGEFIPLLEETGLIHSVGEWVLHQVCTDLREWDRAGVGVDRVWVNVSAQQLVSGDLVGLVDRVLREEGISGDRLGIELTESGVTGDIRESVRILSQLRRRGLHIAMDDFGKGYSALTFLRQLPFDLVKIDLSFVRDLPDSAENRSLVRAIIAMTHGLGLSVLAEGVETRAQASCLALENCDFAQGFLFARPMPQGPLIEHLRSPDHPYSPDTHPASR
ncbi:putative bifunctional diguanylate cyclase/phosphodiesterase [Thiohalorhabdus sp. Cl-TMA]|uniref:Bifunctional diguanylate cyclase/phosphodiesterase n=1 Tax=Thiohalorhabdus methylotrophus TaxID=3242694 RepID=A0ABV4TSN5_9GAMM